MKQKIVICLLAFVAFLSISTLQAQGWVKTFTSPLGDTTFAVSAVETLDSGFVFAGGSFASRRRLSNGFFLTRLLVVRADKKGNVVWKYAPTDLFTTIAFVLNTVDRGFLIVSNEINRVDLGLPSILVIKLNSNGVEQSRKYYLEGNYLSDASISVELDRIAITAFKLYPNHTLKESNLLQMSINGDSLSRYTTSHSNLGSVIFGGDKQVYALRYPDSTSSSMYNIVKYSQQGDSLWMSSSFNGVDYIKRANDGRILVNSYLKFDYDSHILFDGKHPNTPIIPNEILDAPIFTQRRDDKNIYALLNYSPITGDSSTYGSYFIKKDSIGRQILAKTKIENISPIQERYFPASLTNMISTRDGGFLIIGRLFSDLEGENKARLIKIDSNGMVYSNFLNGKIFIDSIQDCQLDASESGFSKRLISVEKRGETRYAITNAIGNYQMQIDTGSYLVKTTLPNQNWRLCTPSVSKQISAFGTTDTANFALQPAFYCPQMRISTTTQGLRRCFDNNFYFIRYTNEGTVAAQNAFITLKLDSLLDFVSATRPLTSRTGQTLRFNLGTVPIGFDDQFSVQVRVKCGDSTQIGRSLCTEARIFPDTVCIPSPNWSGANIVVSGRCDRDSVRFLIQNTGTATSANLRRQIVEDEIVFLNGTINVPASGNRMISVPANGKTWRLTMDQEPNNPLMNRPTAVIEGCRTSTTQPISTGFVNQFPTDDGSPTIDNVCAQIVGAFDPNDKEGLPLGYKTQRFIEQNTPIDYRIRFQNTGNDTAFTVVLRDTLSDFLDISSIKIGASSHKYSWSIEGRNVLVFRFDNIKLVDSFRNVAASQGFVSFKINQKKDVALGSKINNEADIYFDYNAPIRTNKTLHTIGKDFIISALQTISPLANVKINVFPNPFNAEATIEITGFEKKGPLSINSNFSLFDAFGKQLRSEKFGGNTYLFKRQDLTTGIYFFRIENNGQLIGTGKFLIR
jgi:Secretion system C-terminal sorting domain